MCEHIGLHDIQETHTHRCLHVHSHHHPSQKQAVKYTLVNRAINMQTAAATWEKNIPQEHAIAKWILSEKTSTRFFQNIKRRHDLKLIIPPAHRQWNEGVSSIYKEDNGQDWNKKSTQNNTVFSPVKRIKQYLKPIMNSKNLQTPEVYHISCSCGACYVGETWRLISIRIKIIPGI